MEGIDEVEVANQLTGEEIHSSPPELLPHFQSSSHLSTSSYNHHTQSAQRELDILDIDDTLQISNIFEDNLALANKNRLIGGGSFGVLDFHSPPLIIGTGESFEDKDNILFSTSGIGIHNNSTQTEIINNSSGDNSPIFRPKSIRWTRRTLSENGRYGKMLETTIKDKDIERIARVMKYSEKLN